ncbi:t26-9p [Thermococcus sp. M39]|uniref:t26-9p n=1 Tax=Thermococcus sp. M39 TaxID=1638262 RepID=UPI0014394612|nr:t26-9p [Thermococcus sp. M39]NJE09242.1 t26-9p [Thermococcus sp. M39]
MVDAGTINAIINGMQNLAGTHPYLILGVVFIILSMASGSRALKLLFGILAAFAFMKEFSLFDAFVNLLKSIPSLLKDIANAFKGVF